MAERQYHYVGPVLRCAGAKRAEPWPLREQVVARQNRVECAAKEMEPRGVA